MIARLLGQDPMFRAAALMSVAALVMLASSSIPLQFVGLMTLLMCSAFTGPRATMFEAVIPVDARMILLARISLGLILVCLPVIAWILAGHLRGLPAEPASVFPFAGPEVRLVALPIAALAVILPHARRPGVLPTPDQRLYPRFAWWAALALGSAGAVGWLPVGIAAVVLAVAAVATLAVTWLRMPKSYQVAPMDAEHAGRSMSAAGAAAPGAPAVRWWRPMFAAVVPGRTLFMMLLVGITGLFDAWLFYLVILLFPDMPAAKLRFQWLYTLPVPRAVLALLTLAPAALALLAVAVVIGVAPLLVPQFNALYLGRPHEYSDHVFDERTMVPLAYWRIAPRGDAPVVQTPWGETTTTDAISLPGLTLYNPYSARTGSSDELIAWQFGRASAAVHGRAFTAAEYYSDNFVAPPRVTHTASVFLLGGSMALAFLILFAWLGELGRSHRLTTRPLLRNGVGALMAIFAGSVAVVELYFMIRHGSQLVVPVGAALAMRLEAALPNIGVVAFVAALPVVALSSLLHWQSGQSDVAVSMKG